MNRNDKFHLFKLHVFVDNVCRKMQVSGATDLASKSTSTTDFNQVKPKEEIDDYCLEMKVRCLCGSSLTSDSIIQVLLLLLSFSVP